MTETNNQEVLVAPVEKEEGSFLNLQFFIKTLLLNWQWFVLSLIIALGIAAVYLRYTPAVYQVTAKVLVKDGDNNGMHNPTANAIKNNTTLGLITTSDGFDNELELLKSTTLAEGCVRDLKLYVDYVAEGSVTDRPIYDKLPVEVDMDAQHLDTLESPVKLEMQKSGTQFKVEGIYKHAGREQSFEKKGTLPLVVKVPVGNITIKSTAFSGKFWAKNSSNLYITITNPSKVAEKYAKALGVEASSKTTTIAVLSRNDQLPTRAIDYLTHIVDVYNRQANADKNQVAERTEEFINERLEKINKELGSTDGDIEKYKRDNNIVNIEANSGLSFTKSDAADAELSEIGTQLLLLQSVKEYMNQPSNKYQTLPSNVGLTDAAATSLISEYNKLVLERSRIMRSASEASPTVQAITASLDDLTASIKRAIEQNRRGLEIKRKGILDRFSKYSGMMSGTPQQERILTEIGRQQSVKSSLYIMLLQKREENSITLAATSDKGRLIDKPSYMGQVSPKKSMIMLIAFILGLALPMLIFIILEFLRFRIEGHEDVEKLTHCPIIADIAMANETTKTKADIVVHENKNNQMEEIFRGMRTNVQFMLNEQQNVIMFTSSTSGEGKTFTASNLAVSFALLGKKVVLVGLDIRRPRLAKLFDVKDKSIGITNLLVKESPTAEEVRAEIIGSGVNKNLDLLLAGPVPPNPTELISRTSLDDIFKVLRAEYDIVIIDTAPVGLVTDTLMVSRVADATVIICRADYTEKTAFNMINSFALAGKLPNVAIAINGIDMSRKKYGYAYGYGKYGKYSKYGYKSTYGGYSKYGGYSYGGYGYGTYGYHSYGYGSYSNSRYGNPNDDSIKK